MTIQDLIIKNRSVRRFQQDHAVSPDTLKGLVNLARQSASAANCQPLKYALSSDADMNEKIFSTLKWAGYLTGWPGPEQGERPAAYIVIMGDTQIAENFWCDHGIAAQSILLGAAEMGLGGCILGAIDKKKLMEIIGVSNTLEILLVLAIGKPGEEVVIETVGSDGDIKYWRDDNGVHHVPKRKIEDIVVKSF